jgi:hypothetical protein
MPSEKIMATLKIPALKPRNPNQQVMMNKRNAGGPMRDKTKEQKLGMTKHKGMAFKQFMEAHQDTPARRGAQASKHMFQVKFISTWKDKELHFDDLQDIVDRINHPLRGPCRTDLSELTELVEDQIGDGANGGYGENAGTWDEIDFDVKSFSEDVLKITYTFGGVCFRKGVQYGETIMKTGVITIMPGNE